MGMYTGLRFKGIIKLECRKDIDAVINSDIHWKQCENSVLKSFGYMERASMIPFGALAYMPDSWETMKEGGTDWRDMIATDGFDLSFNKDTGRLTFQCSLKNYNDEIDIFISNVIPEICESVEHCEEYYEEDDVSDLYYLEDGEMVRYEGIRYRFFDEEVDMWI